VRVQILWDHQHPRYPMATRSRKFRPPSNNDDFMDDDSLVHEIVHGEPIRPVEENRRRSQQVLLSGSTFVYGAIILLPYFGLAVPAIMVNHFDAATHFIEAARPMQQCATLPYILILFHYFPTPMVGRILDKVLSSSVRRK
jgi:hypothetical protein